MNIETTSNNSDNSQYLVLARKYRPRNFDSMIGQDALVRTLSNAIKANRLHHAYILNGVRGVGKTTSARILAKVLNCENGPSITWDENDPHALAIEKGNHVDVLEFDAASNTGVEDIKELFEGVNYAPVQGRYKVYIVDEIHMLSKQAFNALLKTLEEPPSYVKFIFATTEVNKIPVTVLSRCQRFDLKRVNATVLCDYFCEIIKKEQVEYEENAIRLISKAADGSVRDGLSLLDQAIALSAGTKVSDKIVSEMLGQVDKGRIYNLFEALMSGKSAEAMRLLSAMHKDGFDPLLIIADLLQLAHLITRIKIVPELANSNELSELEQTRGKEFADKLAMENLSRAYQVLFAVANDAKRADRPFETVEMGLVRVAYLASLPAVSKLLAEQQAMPADIKKAQPNAQVAPVAQAAKPVLEEGSIPNPEVIATNSQKQVTDSPKKPINGAASRSQAAAVDNSSASDGWRSLIKTIRQEQASLSAMLEHQVRVISFFESEYKLELEVLAGLHSQEEILKPLNAFLNARDGKKWQITTKRNSNSETLAETKEREKQARIITASSSHEFTQINKAFPDSQVVDVQVAE